MHISSLTGLALLLGLVSCATAGSRQAPAPPPTATVDAPAAVDQSPLPREGMQMSEFSISMRRGACFGRCPQYRVTIDGAGGVEFVGDRFVNALGSFRGRADMAAVAELRRKAADVFATLADVVPGAAGCRHYATDHPQITLELRTAEGVRTLRHDSGCAAPPAALGELEQLIDSTAQVDEWVSGRAVR
ncbi:DUF6438 domain-containing protein [Solimonas terrae]|uniref:DUF6438 domain-containing protein n=1 Tax=Solimonas terrae TaxID=1396819 RepID=A0A6M2BNR7_9GAMM|nr:DUF6438 domain-containing protein [Solimonas terrae]NGY03851.1 hypothetical protein [Solimonas terrae]